MSWVFGVISQYGQLGTMIDGWYCCIDRSLYICSLMALWRVSVGSSTSILELHFVAKNES